MRLGQGVDIGRRAIAVLRQRLHRRIIQIAAPEPKDRQIHTAVAFFGDVIGQFLCARQAHVEIAIGGQNDPADLVFFRHSCRHGIGLFQPALSIGRPTRPKVRNGLQDGLAVGCRGRFQHQPGRPGIGDNRHLIIRAQVIQHEPEGLLQQRQFRRFVHRPGGVDQEHQVQRVAVGDGGHLPLNADADQLGVRVPGGGHHADSGLERRITIRGGIGVGEIVDHLLDPHRIWRGQLARVQRLADDRIGCGIDVDGKGRHRLFGGDVQRVDRCGGKGFRVGFGGNARVIVAQRRFAAEHDPACWCRLRAAKGDVAA